MTERANYFKLGLFVIVATCLLLAGVALLGADALFRKTVTFETCFDESVNGLDVGSAVRLRGVQLGKVSRIDFARDIYGASHPGALESGPKSSYVVVEFEVTLRTMSEDDLLLLHDRDVEAGLRARLAMTGITGGVFLELVYLDPATNPPLAITWTPEHPYIPGVRSVLEQLTSAAERVAGQLEEANIGTILSNLDKLLVSTDAKVDQLDVTKLQSDAIALIEELRGSNRRLHEILDNPAVDSTLTNASKTMASIQEVVGGGETDLAAFVRSLPGISTRIGETLSEIDRLLSDEQITRMLANLSKASDSAPAAMNDLRQLARRLDTLLASQQQDIEAIVSTLRQTLANLEAVSADAKQNPSRILFGDPPPPINPAAGNRSSTAAPAEQGRRK